MIKIAVPNKGRLNEPAVQLLAQAGFKIADMGERRLFGTTVDPEVQILFLRAGDIPEFVYSGAADLGITGYDIVRENNYDVELLLNLNFGKARLAVAAPRGRYRSMEQVEENVRVATEFPHLTEQFFSRKGKRVEVVQVSGATELTPHIGVADLIVDLVGTGSTLKVNNLEVVEEILETSVYLIAGKGALAEKREKVDSIVLALQSVLRAKKKKLLMMNVPKESLQELRKVISGMAGPTISEVASEQPMVGVNVVVEEEQVYRIISRLKEVGARDILVIDIERIIE